MNSRVRAWGAVDVWTTTPRGAATVYICGTRTDGDGPRCQLRSSAERGPRAKDAIEGVAENDSALTGLRRVRSKAMRGSGGLCRAGGRNADRKMLLATIACGIDPDPGA